MMSRCVEVCAIPLAPVSIDAAGAARNPESYSSVSPPGVGAAAAVPATRGNHETSADAPAATVVADTHSTTVEPASEMTLRSGRNDPAAFVPLNEAKTAFSSSSALGGITKSAGADSVPIGWICVSATAYAVTVTPAAAAARTPADRPAAAAWLG